MKFIFVGIYDLFEFEVIFSYFIMYFGLSIGMLGGVGGLGL